jgi:hypothetical protein
VTWGLLSVLIDVRRCRATRPRGATPGAWRVQRQPGLLAIHGKGSSTPLPRSTRPIPSTIGLHGYMLLLHRDPSGHHHQELTSGPGSAESAANSRALVTNATSYGGRGQPTAAVCRRSTNPQRSYPCRCAASGRGCDPRLPPLCLAAQTLSPDRDGLPVSAPTGPATRSPWSEGFRSVTDSLVGIDGFSHAYFMVDRDSGRAMWITILDSEEALTGSVS